MLPSYHIEPQNSCLNLIAVSSLFLTDAILLRQMLSASFSGNLEAPTF
jgi:hypothetical protein